MQTLDAYVMTAYLVGVLAIGVVFAARNTSTSEMFAAGGQSPWWVAGLSGFMTMFSAGTFVVWGGIAYKHGAVAVTINLCYGVAALLAGWTVAGKWKELGVTTPAEYVRLRFGPTALHFYTWAIMAFKLVSTGVALYALCVLLSTFVQLPEGAPFRDAATGALSLSWSIVFLGGVVILYTMIGGLWGVLMTDVLQFIVLNLAVLLVVPLAFARVGGPATFVQNAPEGFFAPTGGDFTWFFLLGWVAIHYFVVGAEWAFVQRCLCVPTPRDARKGVVLFGLLYLVSPAIWLLPPMIERVRVPIAMSATAAEVTALGERAYIDICQAVLPPGLMGLMLAAMFSATASMVSSQLNVFAGVMTNDIFRPMMAVGSWARLSVWVGRACTVAVGAAIVGIALAVPHLGGAEKVIVPATSLMVVPLLAPLLIGVLSRRLPGSAVWASAAISCAAIAFVKLGLGDSGFAASWPGLGWLRGGLESIGRSSDLVLGVVLPLLVCLVWTRFSRGEAVGWGRLTAHRSLSRNDSTPQEAVGRGPALVVAWSLAACAALVASLIPWAVEGRWLQAIFAAVLLLMSAVIFYNNADFWIGHKRRTSRVES